MPNQEHVTRLLEGHLAWNAWRQHHPELCPDLSKAKLAAHSLGAPTSALPTLVRLGEAVAYPNVGNFCAANLTRANLRAANLSGVVISLTNLANSNLSRAYLADANLCWSNLDGTDLFRSVLYKTMLVAASLKGASLTNAEISGADLSLADLSGANLTEVLGAQLFSTNFHRAELIKGQIYDVPREMW